MAAFLSGGTGFVGGHLARVLTGRGMELRCLVRAASRAGNLRDLPVEQCAGDLRDPISIRRALAGCDLVFHCAADYRLHAPDPRQLHENNVVGTANLLRAAADAGVRKVIYTSSVATLRPAGEGTLADEAAQATPEELAGHYERSKLLAEQEVERWMARGLPIVVVMPSAPIGERDVKPTPTGQIIVDFLRGRLPAYVDTGLNLVDVRDVAEGHVLAAERGAPGTRYILGHRNLTLREILGLLAELTGLRAPRVRLPHWLPVAIAAVEAPFARWRGKPPRVPLEGARMARRRMFFDAGRAVRELGVPQTPIEEALARAVRWFVENGYAPRPPALGAEG